MAAGDVLTFVLSVQDDGTLADTQLTGNGIVVADDITMCSLGRNRAFVVVIKAA